MLDKKSKTSKLFHLVQAQQELLLSDSSLHQASNMKMLSYLIDKVQFTKAEVVSTQSKKKWHQRTTNCWFTCRMPQKCWCFHRCFWDKLCFKRYDQINDLQTKCLHNGNHNTRNHARPRKGRSDFIPTK